MDKFAAMCESIMTENEEEFKVGDYAKHKKGDANGKGFVYKVDKKSFMTSIYLEDEWGNQSKFEFDAKDFKKMKRAPKRR